MYESKAVTLALSILFQRPARHEHIYLIYTNDPFTSLAQFLTRITSQGQQALATFNVKMNATMNMQSLVRGDQIGGLTGSSLSDTCSVRV